LPPTEFPRERQRYADFRFCPRCGTAFRPEDFHAAEVLFTCASCDFDFYQNPLPAAVVALLHPDDPSRVLMLRRKTEPGRGLWCVPGGFIGYGESPERAAEREVREEVGVESRIEGVIRAGLVDYAYRGRQICIVEVAFRAVAVGPLPREGAATAEAAEIAFHAVGDVLADSGRLAFPEQAEIFRHLDDEVHRGRAPSGKRGGGR
jgi:ADP-ribose pyrophosphatase YjhB (NUDIX family)